MALLRGRAKREQPARVLVVADTHGRALAVARHPGAVLVNLGDDVQVSDRDLICLAVRDVSALRRAVSGLPNLGRAAQIECLLVIPAESALSACRLGDGPALETVSSDRSSVSARYAGAVPARRVLLEVARLTGRTLLTHGWPVVDIDGAPEAWPPADPAARMGNALDPRPADVVLGPEPHREFPIDEVLGRAPVHVLREADPSWAQAGPTDPASGPVLLGGLDDQVCNPIGFRAEPAGGLGVLGGAGERLVLTHARSTSSVDESTGVVDGGAALVHDLEAVELTWSGGTGPRGYARAVAALAMSGVPLHSRGAPPTWAVDLLGQPLVSQLTLGPLSVADADPADRALHREELSVALRRTALETHSAGAVRRLLAQRLGLSRSRPKVSVLLSSRRPDMVGFALDQLAAQEDVELEVVLALHGVQLPVETRFPAGLSVRQLEVPAELPFGEVLNLASREATGDLFLKMDDDDWYGPRFVADLVLAHGYSGAELTGVAPEFWYLEGSRQTVRHRWPNETFVDFVAGGSLLVTREAFLAVGGFRPVRRHVDATLLTALRAAGAQVYRTHGLAYVLRRTAEGHTWAVSDRELVEDTRTISVRDGFTPSSTLNAPSYG